MKRYRFIFWFLLFYLGACKNSDRAAGESENNIDAARNFIRAALDGKFNDARNYMLKDSVNTNYLDVVERSYKNTDQSIRDGYRASSIRIINKNEVNDSTTIIIYSNSFKNDPDTLKVLKIDNQWLVDLKYLYLHSMDTIPISTLSKDSLP